MSSGRNPSGRTTDEAARRLVKLRLGRATVQDRREFEAWRSAHPEHEEAYRLADNTWAGLGQLRHHPEFARLLSQDASRKPNLGSRLKRILRQAGLRPAFAALAVAVFAVVGFREWTAPRTAFSEAGFTASYQTAVGHVEDEELPDGSVISVGARTRIDVRFTPSERHVTLREGQAFFSVAKDPARPFVVDASGTIVRDLDTKFDVDNEPREVRVAVLEGVVEVTRAAAVDSSAKKERKPDGPRLVTAGQQIMALNDAQPILQFEPKITVQPGAWRAGRLSYNGATLAEVISDANRYYHGHITIASAQLAQMRITASFGSNEIDQMLASLAATMPLEVHRNSGGEVILAPK